MEGFFPLQLLFFLPSASAVPAVSLGTAWRCRNASAGKEISTALNAVTASFIARSPFPSTVDNENVNAQYDSGVLQLEMQKRTETKPKQIKIGAGGNSVESKAAEKKTVEGVKSAA